MEMWPKANPSAFAHRSFSVGGFFYWWGLSWDEARPYRFLKLLIDAASGFAGLIGVVRLQSQGPEGALKTECWEWKDLPALGE